MADPWGNDDSNPFGTTPPASDPNDPNQGWDYNWLNPYGDYIAGLPDLMPGPLSPQRINGPREFYTDPRAYFAMRDASNGLAGFGSDMTSEVGPPSEGWDNPIGDTNKGLAGFGSDTMTGGGGSDGVVGDVGIDPPIPDQFGHPNPLPPMDPAFQRDVEQEANAHLKTYGKYAKAAGAVSTAVGEAIPPTAEVAIPLGKGLGAVGTALEFDPFRAFLAHLGGELVAKKYNDAISDANNEMGNQYFNDAGGFR